ncbi:MAG TPA: hypothetical protein VL172_17280, partial [Kofleriaceae bacterium]|nr:hypothetical protein [Kofleriaceae bacterium]
MQTRAAALTAFLAAAAAACGCAPGPSAQRAAAPASPGDYAAGAEDSGDGDYGGSPGAYQPAPPPPAPGPGGIAVQPPPQQPQQRPGLGTVWGENLYSRVETRPFVRAGDAPFAAVRIHYNDADGVSAQMSYVGAPALAPMHAYTPYGGVSVALTDEYGNVLPGGEAG